MLVLISLSKKKVLEQGRRMLPVSLSLIPNESYPYEEILTLSSLTKRGENLLGFRLIK